MSPASPSPIPEQQVVELATAILSGKLGIIEGSRRLCSLRSRVSPFEHDSDFLPFIGIDSESDQLPIGDVRQHWAAAALACKDIEIEQTEAFYRDRAIAACERLLARFGSQVNGDSRIV